MTTLPWEPLFTVERSHHPELTVSGIVSVWDGTGKEQVAHGDTQFMLWSRSLLKPWQLLAVYPTLKATYPGLMPKHYAVMLGSHQGEAMHEEVLRQIMMIRDISMRELKCPACFPLSKARSVFLRAKDEHASPIYHPCAGKHLAYILSLHAQDKFNGDYLDPQGEPYSILKSLLALLLDKDPEQLAETKDGCGMPNYGLSACDMAKLFCHMAALDVETEAENSTMGDLIELRTMMVDEAPFTGGTGRLDTELMLGKCIKDDPPIVVAKEGADGLLGIGIGPSERFPKGLGILIKLASGYEPTYLRKIALTVLNQLGFKTLPLLASEYPVSIQYHIDAHIQ